MTCDFRLADKTKFAVTAEYIEAGGARFSGLQSGVIGGNGRVTFADF
jgi:hypothetical protein